MRVHFDARALAELAASIGLPRPVGRYSTHGIRFRAVRLLSSDIRRRGDSRVMVVLKCLSLHFYDGTMPVTEARNEAEGAAVRARRAGGMPPINALVELAAVKPHHVYRPWYLMSRCREQRVSARPEASSRARKAVAR